VANKPRLVDVADDLLARIRDVEVLVGYNWPFDHGMLEAELGKRWLDTIEGKPVLDPLVLARMEWPGRGGHGLGQVAKKLELARKGQAHRASSDAQLACEVLFKLGHHLSEDAHEASQQIVAARIGQDKKRKQYWG
jgi:DNA polymerase III alpha subunit (gram-positive type)